LITWYTNKPSINYSLLVDAYESQDYLLSKSFHEGINSFPNSLIVGSFIFFNIEGYLDYVEANVL
jgi:hypothetical protein